MILFMFSRCFMVIRFCRLRVQRAISSSVITHANPPKIAPATKYGGKIVVCQPGSTDVAKSNDTVEGTDKTSGVEIQARTRYAISEWRHCRFPPRHPKASIPYTIPDTFPFARSRIVAK